MLDSKATTPQSAPTGDGIIVLEQVLRRIGPVAYISLVKDLKDRAEMGFKKYGTYLRTNNGRDPQVDMYQELLDALMYSTQALLEGNKLAEVFFDVLVALSAQMAYQLREVTECTEKRSTPSAE